MRRQRSDWSEAMTYITSNVMISTLWPGTDTGCRLGVLETIVPVSLSDATDVLSGLDLDIRSSEHIEHPGEVERCLLPGVIAAGGTAVPGDHLRLEQRSEERRVGKECRARWRPGQHTQKRHRTARGEAQRHE